MYSTVKYAPNIRKIIKKNLRTNINQSPQPFMYGGARNVLTSNMDYTMPVSFENPKYYAAYGGAMKHRPMMHNAMMNMPNFSITKKFKEHVMQRNPKIAQHIMQGGKMDFKKIIKEHYIAHPEHFKSNASGKHTFTGGKRNAFKEFTHKLGRGVKSIAIDLSKPLDSAIRNIGKAGIKSGEKIVIDKLEGLTGGKMRLPRSGNKRNTARGDIVRAIMVQRGVNLPTASSIVKREGLY
jgi:hypothetical protein